LNKTYFDNTKSHYFSRLFLRLKMCIPFVTWVPCSKEWMDSYKLQDSRQQWYNTCYLQYCHRHNHMD